jgi:hypothetical protein
MDRIFGALVLLALVAIPFWFWRRKKAIRSEDWNNQRESVHGGIGSDAIAPISGDGGNH